MKKLFLLLGLIFIFTGFYSLAQEPDSNMSSAKKTKPKLLQISELGNDVLRKQATPVEKIDDKEIQDLIDDLIATIKDVGGVGIAAPQVYESKRIFIIASKPSQRYPNAPKMAPTAIINPKIISHSDEKMKDWEGCLSILGIRAMVPRYKSITVEYTDRNGKIQKTQFDDFVARIFQHEYDHLDGIVYLDRIDSSKDIVTEKEYQKIIARKTETDTPVHK